MAQDTPAAAAGGGGTLVIPGEMAARIDRLPRSWVHWEICLLVILSWATTASTDGIAARLYPFVWIPNHAGISQSEYSWLFALEGGISILLGGYALGWLSDKIGRRKALILSVLLAAAFIWPFGYVTNYPALVLLSIADTLGFAGVLAINVVYVSEMTGPAVRAKVTLYSQALAIFVFYVILTGLIPHYMFPSQYRAYLFVLTGVNVLMALALAWRMPESPRWLEARERHDEARKIMERIEARVKKHHVLPEPDLTPYEVVAEEQPKWWAPFGKQYLVTTVFLLVVMVLGYGGIVYGFGGYAILFLSESRGYGAGFVFALTAWAGVAATAAYLVNAFFGDRIERKTTVMIGAILFAVSWYILYNVHDTAALYVLYILGNIGVVLWLWGMYAYIPPNFPTRMRSLGTGWTDGVGHLGAWGGTLLAGHVFLPGSPLNWILLVTIPGALLPGFMVGIFGKRQHRRALEELTH